MTGRPLTARRKPSRNASNEYLPENTASENTLPHRTTISQSIYRTCTASSRRPIQKGKDLHSAQTTQSTLGVVFVQKMWPCDNTITVLRMPSRHCGREVDRHSHLLLFSTSNLCCVPASRADSRHDIMNTLTHTRTTAFSIVQHSTKLVVVRVNLREFIGTEAY